MGTHFFGYDSYSDPGELVLRVLLGPTYKGNVENYRPISLISLVMKVFERILYEELLNLTESKIDPRQHGFLKRKSCTTNLLSFTNSIALSLHEKTGVDVVYFDFAKAFDTVPHDLILNKLKNQYKIDGSFLKLIVNYLKGRKQRVILDNAASECIDVLAGVPMAPYLAPYYLYSLSTTYTKE